MKHCNTCQVEAVKVIKTVYTLKETDEDTCEGCIFQKGDCPSARGQLVCAALNDEKPRIIIKER